MTRGTGIVSLVLLTASVALGVAELVRFASPRWPRFVVAALHRNVALLATAFLAAHILTAVLDSFAKIRLVDVFVPFVGSYRPVWLGLGAVAFDLILALVVTSLLRERLGHRTWRAVHWAAYAAWPIALLHGLGTGSDTRMRWAVVVNVACLAAVLAAVLTRVGWSRAVSGARRAAAAFGSVALASTVVAWMLLEPMRPGWARKSGTPAALLTASSPAGAPIGAANAISFPFTSAIQGSIRQSGADGTGTSVVTIDAVLPAIGNGRLRVVIKGVPLISGGVRMQSGSVFLGTGTAPNSYRGPVTSLGGSSLRAFLQAPNGSKVTLSMDLTVDDSTGTLGGTVTARSGAGIDGE